MGNFVPPRQTYLGVGKHEGSHVQLMLEFDCSISQESIGIFHREKTNFTPIKVR